MKHQVTVINPTRLRLLTHRTPPTTITRPQVEALRIVQDFVYHAAAAGIVVNVMGVDVEQIICMEQALIIVTSVVFVVAMGNATSAAVPDEL